ncbi:hypothetical protein ABPG75_007380 [Micractinium tetrahymenae]
MQEQLATTAAGAAAAAAAAASPASAAAACSVPQHELERARALALRSCANLACPCLVGGSEKRAQRCSKLCGGGCGSRFCSEGCLRAAWRAHKPCCRVLAAAGHMHHPACDADS